MSSLLQPGYLFWDGIKYVTNSAVGPPGPSGNAVLVYRQGGTAKGNVYTSWTLLMLARSVAASTPMTIYIDTTFVPSGATLDVGSWSLGKNTTIEGYIDINVGNYPILQFTEGVQLLDASVFRNIKLIGVVSPITTTPCVTNSSFSSLDIEFDNVIVQAQSSVAVKPIFLLPGGTENFISSHGFTEFSSSDNPIFVDSGSPSEIIGIFNDFTTASDNTFQLTVSEIEIVMGTNCQVVLPQTRAVGRVFLIAGNFSNDWNSSSVGATLIKTDAANATWVNPLRILSPNVPTTYAYTSAPTGNFILAVLDITAVSSGNIVITFNFSSNGLASDFENFAAILYSNFTGVTGGTVVSTGLTESGNYSGGAGITLNGSPTNLGVVMRYFSAGTTNIGGGTFPINAQMSFTLSLTVGSRYGVVFPLTTASGTTTFSNVIMAISAIEV